ncbi:uncharacterized protein APUU_21436S [Aspergillus puulaauensis]|uniref:Uncharacterized protein n=1 Tax=Aspergillus puulaauensis TaxID=1220207 RepID=A0A7R7XGS1_9EURO|nr:uncharacterized protein APUU_21436S [Aspergillus puulaauensis]BCS21004.1 hypothetical protein APUU_21436S [Aspergillus puulaauensis]
MQRDAHLIFARSLSDLQRILAREVIATSIAGFIVTDAKVMGIDTDIDPDTDANSEEGSGDAEMARISRVLGGIVNGTYFYSNTHALAHLSSNGAMPNRGLIPGFGGPRRTNPPSTREWTVVFAFDFPSQAARYPLRFGRYMAETFGVGWRMCGATKGKCALEISERGLRKMGERVYRGNKYQIRAVFLGSVDERDKVLVVAKGASVGNGGLGSQGQPEVYRVDEDQSGGEDGEGCVRDMPAAATQPTAVAAAASAGDTDSTAGEDGEFDIEQVEVGDEGVGWTLAADSNGPTGPLGGEGEELDMDMEMIDAEYRREEHDWADDELTSTEGSDSPHEDENEGASTTSSSSSDADDAANKRVIYVNIPDQRGNQNADSDDASAAQSPNKKKKKKETPKHVANCPVAIHEVKQLTGNWVQNGQRPRMRGYVGFAGHVEDNRSMASLILGMCAVRNTRPLPESMRAFLRDHNLG